MANPEMRAGLRILINARDNASGVFDKLSNKVKLFGAAIAGYFGIKAFAGAVSSAADFEEAMSKVQAATEASGAELEALKKAAEQAGATTKFTGVQAAQALENLAKAGLSGKEAIAALPAVMAMAQAGGVSLADASERLTGVVMGMGLQFGESARVADVLAMGANASRTSITGLAEAMSYAAPVAKTIGLSLESTTAIVAQFANAGIDAGRAGTALNSILSQFSDPASKFRSELAALGITTTNFDEALKQLAATGPNGAAAVRAVGLEAGPALQSALNLGIPALEALRAKLHDSAGSAKATADVMGNNLRGALTGLSSAWDAVTTVLGTPVLPALKSAVEQLAGALRSAVADGTVQRFGEAIAAAFQSGATWARAFLATIDFGKLTTDLRDFADRTGAAFAQVGEYATNAGNIVKLVYGVMSAGTNTVMGAIYGIGAAFAGVASNIQSGLALIYDNFAKVTFGDVSKAYKLAADEIRLSAETTWAASEALGAKSTTAFIAVADGAQLARDGFAELASGTAAATPAIASAAAAAAASAEKIAQVNAAVAVMREEYAALIANGDLEAAAAKTREIDAALATLSTTLPAATDAQKKKTDADAKATAAAAEHAAALAKLREEYAALIASGDLQGAAEKLQQINAALRGAGPAVQDAAQAATALADAYINLGVTSSAALTNLASKAKSDFELIKNSASASAADVGAAFAAAAEKAIAANNGLAPSWVKAEAAARGYKIEMDAAGKETLKLVNASQGAAQALKTLGIDAETVSTKISSGFKESAVAVTALQNNFSALEAQGVQAAEAITLGLNKMLSEAKNQADLDALKAKVQELRSVLGEQVANGFLEQAAKKADELKAAMDAATPGINSAAEAFKELGITSDKELKQTAATAKEAFEAIKASGTASPREISEAWKAMAEASIAANDGVADAAITSGAAAQGFAIEVDAAGKASVKSLEKVEGGLKKIDYAAQMAGKSVEELQSIKSQGWGIAEDMKEAADIQNAATNALTNAWRKSIVEADEYYQELSKIYRKHEDFQNIGPWGLDKAIWEASAAMKELDKQQQAIERSGSDAAQGLAGLQDRLLQLSGSEEEVAAARYARDQAETQQKMALLKLDIERARIRKDAEEVTLLEKELDTYQQQLRLLEQIYRKEKSQREEKDRAEKEAESQRKAEQAAREAADKKERQERDESTKKEARLKERDGSGSGSG
ncbi:phage tail tape measure protein, partial [Simplicispira psychrophila]|uniref:phage tail tape measure protein n=1 Tax=Simplicispira psychrophila TaxID=80882 RepID=UPI0012EBB64E